ncbi:MAG: pyridoxamine kinase [Erysipelotrichia bacterium]|nr:pyridoxamine kinase [Erysipelotrichia bacterium]
MALPILSACGYETAILPSSILSTHTSGFKDFVAKDLDEQMYAFADHWKKEGLKFDVVYTGYLGSISLIDFAISAIDNFKKSNALVFVDPALGDKGKLYPVFNVDYALKMRELLAKADVVKPNITEACFITATPYQEKYNEAFVKDLIAKLRLYTEATIILTDVSFAPESTGVYIYENKQYKYYKHQKLGDGFHGTGDIFSASFVAALLKTHSIYNAAKVAADYVYRCIKITMDDKNHWYGVKFEQLLNDFVNRINNKKGKFKKI